MKSQEALRKSQEFALSLSQQQVDVFHLLYALIGQEGSIVPTVLGKIGADIEKMKHCRKQKNIQRWLLVF
jgi:ATP-dependent Clp protease ATP-binding subunit ClpB